MMSCAVPIQWTSVPFPVKALKLLVGELQSQFGSAPEAKSRTDADDGDAASDDDVCRS
jgi:hypothetical protein